MESVLGADCPHTARELEQPWQYFLRISFKQGLTNWVHWVVVAALLMDGETQSCCNSFAFDYMTISGVLDRLTVPFRCAVNCVLPMYLPMSTVACWLCCLWRVWWLSRESTFEQGHEYYPDRVALPHRAMLQLVGLCISMLSLHLKHLLRSLATPKGLAAPEQHWFFPSLLFFHLSIVTRWMG